MESKWQKQLKLPDVFRFLSSSMTIASSSLWEAASGTLTLLFEGPFKLSPSFFNNPDVVRVIFASEFCDACFERESFVSVGLEDVFSFCGPVIFLKNYQ